MSLSTWIYRFFALTAHKELMYRAWCGILLSWGGLVCQRIRDDNNGIVSYLLYLAGGPAGKRWRLLRVNRTPRLHAWGPENTQSGLWQSNTDGTFPNLARSTHHVSCHAGTGETWYGWARGERARSVSCYVRSCSTKLVLTFTSGCNRRLRAKLSTKMKLCLAFCCWWWCR